LDIASEGDTVETARLNVAEAVELFFETADVTDVAQRRRRAASRSMRLPNSPNYA